MDVPWRMYDVHKYLCILFDRYVHNIIMAIDSMNRFKLYKSWIQKLIFPSVLSEQSIQYVQVRSFAYSGPYWCLRKEPFQKWRRYVFINFILLQQFSKVGFFYKSNSLNPFRYFLAKETNTQKSWVILQSFNSFTIKLTKTLIAKLPHAKCFFCINVSFMIKELKFCKIAQLFCLSVFLAR